MSITKPKPLKLTRPEPTESAVQSGILKALGLHPFVAWHGRFNSGAAMIGEGKALRFVRYHTVKGCSDILGQLKDGRFLAIEVKRPSGRVTPDQAAFLAQVQQNGGVAFVARSVEEAWKVLDGVMRDRNSANENARVVELKLSSGVFK